MSSFTFMEASIQQGVIRRILAGLLIRTLHHIVFDRDALTGVRTFRVWEGPPSDTIPPVFSYDIPERRRGESSQMWDDRVSLELPTLWNASRDARIALAKANCPPPEPKPPGPRLLTDAEAREQLTAINLLLQHKDEPDALPNPDRGLPSEVPPRKEPQQARPVKARGRKAAGRGRALQKVQPQSL